MNEEIKMCGGCGKNPAAEELHPCPYHEEINGDAEPCCDCCADCIHECCMDI